MAYVDGFIVPVKKSKLDAYRKLAEFAREVWLDHGAIDYAEWVADDVSVGKLTSFPRSVILEEDEIVVFAWITYESREKRDEVNAKVMADTRMTSAPDDKAFDGKRMIFGGFLPLVVK